MRSISATSRQSTAGSTSIARKRSLLAAARVGGIHANNTHPGDFLYDNLAIATNVIEASRRTGVAKLVFLGSSCIYPRLAPQPMPESCLLTGSLEPTNEWYAIAKIAGLKLCQAYRRQHGCDFVSVMPTNLYGPNDNFDLLSSHVLPALLAKIDAAVREGRDTVEIWGSGRPRREFLHVDDLADAVIFLLKSWSDEEPINIGTGSDVRIAELAELIAEIVGFKGRFVYDVDKAGRDPPQTSRRRQIDRARAGARASASRRESARPTNGTGPPASRCATGRLRIIHGARSGDHSGQTSEGINSRL